MGASHPATYSDKALNRNLLWEMKVTLMKATLYDLLIEHVSSTRQEESCNAFEQIFLTV